MYGLLFSIEILSFSILFLKITRFIDCLKREGLGELETLVHIKLKKFKNARLTYKPPAGKATKT